MRSTFVAAPAARVRLHGRVLGIGVLAILAHQLVVPDRLHELSYDAIEVYVLLAMVWSIRHYRPRPARPWWLLATGVGLLVVGDVIYNALTQLNGHEVFPSVADALYLASYIVLSCGVIAVLRRRRPEPDRTALLDTVLVSVASAAVTWVYLIAPADDGSVPILNRLVSAAYPVGDLILLAFLARLLISRRTRPPAERILAVGISLLLMADVVYARLALTQSYAVGSWLDALFHLSYLCFAVAAAHPTMRALVEPDPVESPERRSRLWLLAGISLVLPALTGIEAVAGHGQAAAILGTASAAAFFLLTFRTGVLNATLVATLGREEDAGRRERVLRRLGTVLVSTLDRREICEAAVEHAAELAGPGAEALLYFGTADAPLVATTFHGWTFDRAPVLDGTLPREVARCLEDDRVAVIEPAAAYGLRAQLPDGFAGRLLVVAPLMTGGRLRGALVVGVTADEDPDRLAAGCEAVGSVVSLSLDASELAEKLVDERSEQRFGALIRNSSDILLVLRADGTVRFLSPSVTAILGWSVRELLGHHVAGLVHPEDASLVTAALEEARTHPGAHGPFQCRYLHKDGTWRSLEAVGTSLLDDPAVAGMIVNVRDVTDRVRLEASLRASEERLESQVAELQELHKVKGDFVATISHELRTPLTSILGKVELLEEGDYGEVTDDQAQALEVIDRNSHRLLVLIEDLLTVARIESARLQLRVAPTSLLPFVEGIAELVQPTAAARSVALQVDAGPGLGEAQIDALQFERALTNLLTNAVKFTPPGGCVTFCARRTDETVVFVVSDNGIGIPLEEQDRLFTRFFRSSLATELAVQGSGLGLVIAKNIVEEHGGTIAVVSAPREGTTVTVSLPVPA